MPTIKLIMSEHMIKAIKKTKVKTHLDLIKIRENNQRGRKLLIFFKKKVFRSSNHEPGSLTGLPWASHDWDVYV